MGSRPEMINGTVHEKHNHKCENYNYRRKYSAARSEMINGNHTGKPSKAGE